MAIFYGKEPAYDVRDLGFDRSLVKGMGSGAGDDIPPDMQSVFQQGLSAALLGSGALGKDLSLGHQTIAAQPTDNLQEIIETLADVGGGTLRLGAYTYVLDYDIEIRAGVNIVGEGADITILDFDGSSHGITVIGTSSENLNDWSIKGITVTGSNNTAGIDVDYSDEWHIENTRVTSGSQNGLRISHANGYRISGVRSDDHAGSGFVFIGTNDTQLHSRFEVINCRASGNGSHGFEISGSGVSMENGIFIACLSFDNTTDGFNIDVGSLDFVNCYGGVGGKTVTGNGRYGFFLSSGSQLRLINCSANYNTTAGVFIDSASAAPVIVGLTGLPNTGVLLDCNDKSASIIGGQLQVGATTTLPSLQITNTDGGPTNLIGIARASVVTERRCLTFVNASGGSFLAGHVVVYDPATGDENANFTTTAGDDRVVGMATETISNTFNGPVLVEGITNVLKVDGTTDIAIGDFLTCFTTNGISAKGAAGDMVFAIALEAYTTNDSNGVIDALLIKPRKL